MNKTREFLLNVLPTALYQIEDDLVLWNLIYEEESFVYGLLKAYYRKSMEEFPYTEADVKLFYDVTTYEDFKLVKIMITSEEKTHTAYVAFTLDEAKEIIFKRYYVLSTEEECTCCEDTAEDVEMIMCEEFTEEDEVVEFIFYDYFQNLEEVA